ncbi:MAG TPA: tRNA (adenosine(37)-N6)-threonylcarbamoyltransferase complex ATPase subunit type 1 TsaE [Gammaproteobacteria bacterium]|nr:tRNA (adenosine(37)-N6)-threonylcarbamoyltransferase complex ATPase subunit type 1 TsaE [Gammaproteobacteria bacterium]
MFQNFLISSEAHMQELGSALAFACQNQKINSCVIYLHGDLGAGKTTCIRGFLRAMGYKGSVKSPTYTLVEPYDFAECKVYHFDFYRLKYPQECEEMGIRDYVHPGGYCLIEWPEKAVGYIPIALLSIKIAINSAEERNVNVESHTSQGEIILTTLRDRLTK